VSEILTPETLEDKFKALESEDKVELMLQELKSKVAANVAGGDSRPLGLLEH
jgi:hypothetical protein